MGVRLTGFVINHQGMAREPYYVIKEVDSKLYMQLAYGDSYEEGSFGLNGFDENEGPYKIVDYSDIQELEYVIDETGAKSWDGFDILRGKVLEIFRKLNIC